MILYTTEIMELLGFSSLKKNSKIWATKWKDQITYCPNSLKIQPEIAKKC
jgi:hypothetical protein